MVVFRDIARLSIMLGAALATTLSAPVQADTDTDTDTFGTAITVTTVTETIEYWDNTPDAQITTGNTSRLLPYDLGQSQIAAPSFAVAEYGPFRLVAPDIAEMTGEVGSDTPAKFRAMLGAHPDIRTLKLVDVAGTTDDDANLALARMIRARNIATHVPANGSVRSGGVELFAAGATRSADPGAEFIVHSWIDEDGMQANDYPMSDPVHQGYIQYYRDMGLSADDAKAFYALTNSVSNAEQRRVTLAELRKHTLIN